MLKWLSKLWKKDELSADNVMQLQNQVIKGLHYGIAQLQTLAEDFNTIVGSLLLDKGGTEYTINKDFFDSFLNSGMTVRYHWNKEGNLDVWLEKQSEEEKCQECGE